MPNTPIKFSYEVEKDNLYAGEYPRALDEWESKEKIKQLLDFGITAFVDLTEEGETAPYTKFLPDACTYSRHSIVDVQTPETMNQLHEIILEIDRLIHLGWKVYVHCLGGIDRTGVIVACWFVYQGLSPEDAFQEFVQRWQTNPKSQKVQPLIDRRWDYLDQYADWLKKRL